MHSITRATPRSIRWVMRLAFCSLLVLWLLMGLRSAAWSFDAAPHLEMTRDVLVREGFQEGEALSIVRVANYQTDGFGSAEDVLDDPGAFLIHAYWDYMYPDPYRDDNARWMHFGYQTVPEPTWERLIKNTQLAVKKAETEDDTVEFLTVLGASLHWLQDFYAHSNWAEKSEEKNWGDKTWFDIPSAERASADIKYVSHDLYNKDYPGRPYYDQAYRQAFYSSWQWVRLVRQWVSSSFWDKAKTSSYPDSISYPDIDTEQSYARYLSWYTGHWKGPSSVSKDDLISLGLAYGISHTLSRGPVLDALVEYIPLLTAAPDPNTSLPTSFPTVPAQQWLELKTLKVGEAHEQHFFGIDPWGTPDFYAIITVNGGVYLEAMHEDDDDFYPSNWHVWVPIDPATQQVSIRYALWDEDVVGGGTLPSFRGGDDHCNIRPGPEIDWSYSGSFASLYSRKISTRGYRDEGEYQGEDNADEAYVEFELKAHMQMTNQAPVPMISLVQGPTYGYEGGLFTFRSDSYDPDNDPLKYRWDLNNDGTWTSWSTSREASVTLGDNDLFIVALEVSDGTVSCATYAGYQPANLPPLVTAGPDETADEGSQVTVSGSFTDPGWLDTHTATIDWGDGSPETTGTVSESNGAGTVSGSHIYDDEGEYIVKLKVKDDDGGEGEHFLDVTVYNVPPTVNAGWNKTVAEGSPVAFSGSFIDPGLRDTHTIEWDFGDRSTATGELGVWHTFAENGTYEVKLRVTDDDGGVGEDVLTVTVYNVPPNAGIDSVVQPEPLFILPVVHTLTFNGSFIDPGWLDTHNATWYFGDGTSAAGTLSEEHGQPDSTGTTSATHAFVSPGTYTVMLQISDDEGSVGIATAIITVVSADEAVARVKDYISQLPDSAFKTNASQWKKILASKLVEIMAKIDGGQYQEAIDKLKNDIRAKADGSLGGNPNNDTISSPAAQQRICASVDWLITYLQTLLAP